VSLQGRCLAVASAAIDAVEIRYAQHQPLNVLGLLQRPVKRYSNKWRCRCC